MKNKKIILAILVGTLMIITGLIISYLEPKKNEDSLNPTPTVTETPSPTPIPEAYFTDSELDDDLNGLVDNQKELQKDQDEIETLLEE